MDEVAVPLETEDEADLLLEDEVLTWLLVGQVVSLLEDEVLTWLLVGQMVSLLDEEEILVDEDEVGCAELVDEAWLEEVT